MKQLKKFLLMLTCIGVLASFTACGSNNDDNGAVKGDGGTDNAATDNTGDAYDNDTNTNDATDGTGDGDGVMDDIGDGIKKGADDLEKDLDGDADNRTDNNDRTDNNTNNQ